MDNLAIGPGERGRHWLLLAALLIIGGRLVKGRGGEARSLGLLGLLLGLLLLVLAGGGCSA